MSDKVTTLALPDAPSGPRASKTRALAPLTQGGSTLTRDQVELLKRTVARGVTDDELALFCHVANRAGLDPFAKQLHAVKRRAKVDGQYRDVMTIQTGIDGFRLVAARSGAHAGTDEAVFEEGPEGRPTKATVTVWKIVGGLRVAFTASARWAEYVQVYRDRESGREEPMGLWGKMPHTMLAKCAEALALRKAFPMDLSGVYAHEEIAQAGGVAPADEPLPVTVEPEAAAPETPALEPGPVDQEAELAAIKARDVRDSIDEMLSADRVQGSKAVAEAAKAAGLTGKSYKALNDAEVVALNAHLPSPWKV